MRHRFSASQRALLSTSLLASLAAVGLLGLGGNASAQSSGAFATRPYAPMSQAPAAPASGRTAAHVSSAPSNGPAPVTMFRASAPPAVRPVPETYIEEVAAPTISAPRPLRPYSIVSQAQQDARSAAWNPSNRDDVVAEPSVSGGLPFLGPSRTPPPVSQAQIDRGPRHHRTPMRRILEDTSRSVRYDLPEAVADALPWVDRDRKNEPFEDVLNRVADDLNRAAKHDPEWALGAQREIRDLSKVLDRFSEPPPLQVIEPIDSAEMDYANGGRPFRPRPIWPGASGRPEAQVRPATIVTVTGTQEGPRSIGVAANYVPSTDDGSTEASAKPAPQRRNTPTRRRSTSSRR